MQLKIIGRDHSVINSTTGVSVQLQAEFDQRTYSLERITGGVTTKGAALVLHFAPDDRQRMPDGLNAILLATNCNGNYAATGLSSYSTPFAGPKLYTLFADGKMNISVEPEAEKAIKNLPHQLREMGG